ncbi:MAG: hypothetical protein KF816_03085 [Melioribacteraceae bacterium]|jgi:enolase|nr:hypothetical protein [Melioribacteraceae bacterium]
MKIKYLVIILVLIIGNESAAQVQVSLLEKDKVQEFLMLNADQYKTINAKVVQIEKILEEDKETIATLKARFKSGDEPGFFEKIKVKRGRDNRVDKIEDLLEEIENKLNSQQKIKYKNIKKPKLKGLQKEEIFGK